MRRDPQLVKENDTGWALAHIDGHHFVRVAPMDVIRNLSLEAKVELIYASVIMYRFNEIESSKGRTLH